MAGPRKIAYLFQENGKDYLFMKYLGHGNECHVQLVVHASTGFLYVRKVRTYMMERKHLRAVTDREARFVSRLSSRAEDDAALGFVRLLGDDEVPPVPQTEPPTWARVTYWPFCNIGAVSQFVGSNRMPLAVVARYISQVLEALRFFYTSGKPILHCDLNLSNICMHIPEGNEVVPDFYIIDLGHARAVDEPELIEEQVKAWKDADREERKLLDRPPGISVPPGQRRRWDVHEFRNGLGYLLPTSEMNLRSILDSGTQEENLHPMQEVMKMIHDLDVEDDRRAQLGSKEPFQDLSPVIMMAGKAEEQLYEEQGTPHEWCKTFDGKLNALRESKPLTFPTREIARNPLGAGGDYDDTPIHGPWRLVDITDAPDIIIDDETGTFDPHESFEDKTVSEQEYDYECEREAYMENLCEQEWEDGNGGWDLGESSRAGASRAATSQVQISQPQGPQAQGSQAQGYRPRQIFRVGSTVLRVGGPAEDEDEEELMHLYD